MAEPVPDEPVDEPAGARAFLERVWRDSDPHAPGGAKVYAPETARMALITLLVDHEDLQAEARRLAAERQEAVQAADQARVDLEAEREAHAATKRWLQAAEEELSRRPTRG